MIVSSPGYGNPGADGMAAAIFTSFLTYHARFPGFLIGVFWTIVMSLNNLYCGITSLNSILFGLQIGIWISCTIFYIFDFERRIQRHFQKLIRGQNFEDEVRKKIFIRILYFVIWSCSIYIIVYLGVWIDFYKNPEKKEEL